MSTEEGEEDRATSVRAKAVVMIRARGQVDAELAGRVEKAAWNWTLRGFFPRERYWANARLRFRYTNKILSMAFNLGNPKNPGLRAKVIEGEISPARLVRMLPWEMCPERWADAFERVARKQLRTMAPLNIKDAVDGLLQCRKCKSKKTTYTQLQTRSADEPLTTFALCIECGARWKE